MTGGADPFRYRANGHRGRVVQWGDQDIVEIGGPELRIAVNMTRGAEILELRHVPSDADLLWHGHPDVVANRGAVSTKQLQAGNFLDHFGGGWQEVLPNAHFPVSYRGSELGQHGEVALLPWRWKVVEDTPDAVAVLAEVELRRLPLSVTRTMRVEGNVLQVDQRLTNLSGEQVEVQWGHHIAFGGPLLVEGCEVGVADGVPTFVPIAETGSGRYQPGSYRWPEVPLTNGHGQVASVPGDDGMDGHLILGPMEPGSILLRGHKHVVELDWDHTVFPYCWIWSVSGGHRDWPLWGRERLITVEPFSSPLIDLHEAVASGTAITLEPAQTTSTHIRLAIRERTTSR